MGTTWLEVDHKKWYSATMGQNFSAAYYTYVSNPDTAPDIKNPPTFDPKLGFEDRQERTILATRAELDRNSVPLKFRDYCVDYYLDFKKCQEEHFPWTKKYCHHYRHAHEHCEKEDAVMRIKEWERERRLKGRAKRIARRESAEEME